MLGNENLGWGNRVEWSCCLFEGKETVGLIQTKIEVKWLT